jgi:protein CMS1
MPPRPKATWRTVKTVPSSRRLDTLVMKSAVESNNKSKTLKRSHGGKALKRGKSNGKSNLPKPKRFKTSHKPDDDINPNVKPVENPRTCHTSVFVPKATGGDALEDDFVEQAIVGSDGEIFPHETTKEKKHKKKGKKEPYVPMAKQVKVPLHPTGDDDHLPAHTRFSAAIKRALGKDATDIEISDYSLDEAVFVPWPETNVKSTLETLPDAIKSTVELDKLVKSVPKGKPGSPVVLIVCPGGMRSADLVRSVRSLSTLPVAKLFAKHFKFEEQRAFLQKSRPAIAVGTPARLEALIATGALSLDSLQLLVVDATHRDEKQRSIIENTKKEFLEMLKRLLPNMQKKQFKLLWF